jgi:hypothetical protein
MQTKTQAWVTVKRSAGWAVGCRQAKTRSTNTNNQLGVGHAVATLDTSSWMNYSSLLCFASHVCLAATCPPSLLISEIPFHLLPWIGEILHKKFELAS